MNPILLYFLALAIPVIIFLIIGAVSEYLSKKRLKDVVAKLGLIQGAHYDVTTNNGNNHRDLIYDHIAYGKNSQNGKINIYFIKNSTYRGSTTRKEVMIKYGNIGKILRISSSPASGTRNLQSEPQKRDNMLTEINNQNAYSERTGKVQAYIRENYKTLYAKEIYNKACEINSYNRPTPYCVIHLHYCLIELINLTYTLRDTDNTAIDYCLLICDMDIALYDEVRKVSIKELHDDFVYAGALSRKIIILEKRGEYQQAIEACDLYIIHI